MIMDLPFRLAVICNAAATLAGLLILLYSFSAWYWTSLKIRRRSCAFIASCYFICALFALGAQTIFLSNFCKWDRCSHDNMDDSEENYCFLSRCNIGQGAACSVAATLLWIAAAITTKFALSSSSLISDREERLMTVEKNEVEMDDHNDENPKVVVRE